MADPFGTVDRLYGLLNPSGGKLLSNGFLFKLDSSKEVKACPLQYPNILTKGSATVLFRDIKSGRDVDEFLLERNDTMPLNLPLQYAGSTEGVGWGYQCASNTVTEFQLTKDIGDKKREKLDEKSYHYHYCITGDEQCKALYAQLKKSGFFDSPEEFAQKVHNTEKKRIKKASQHWFIGQ